MSLSFQLLRKRHIGNDIVTIVFQEPDASPFTPEAITSQFQHVFIVVRAHYPNTDKTSYRYIYIYICLGNVYEWLYVWLYV